MKDYLFGLAGASSSTVQAYNDVREYLQARILGVLQQKGAMIPLAFLGGTALRFLYATVRYSEDLDFSLEGNRENYDFKKYLQAVKKEFSLENYDVSIKVNDSRTVNSAFIRFRGLPFELGMSSDEKDTLSVKLEVDTNPPAGAVLATTVVRRFIPLQLQHHDRASLLSGKLHAIMQRPYLKGRDVYDLIWYLGDPSWPPPNIELLNNALEQTGYSGTGLTQENWKSAVRARLKEVTWDRVEEDVAPFLGPGADQSIVTEENIMRLLE